MKYVLKSRQDRLDASSAVLRATEGQVVEIKDQTRTAEQSALLHVYLGDISKQMKWHGLNRTVDDWKTLMVSAHMIACGQPSNVCPGLENEIVQFRKSTTAMSIKELSSLVEYVLAWGALHGVKFSADPRYGDE